MTHNETTTTIDEAVTHADRTAHGPGRLRLSGRSRSARGRVAARRGGSSRLARTARRARHRDRVDEQVGEVAALGQLRPRRVARPLPERDRPLPAPDRARGDHARAPASSAATRSRDRMITSSEPAARGLDREALPRLGAVAPGPRPGGDARADPRGREVRLAPRLQVLDVRDLVDPPGHRARPREPGRSIRLPVHVVERERRVGRVERTLRSSSVARPRRTRSRPRRGSASTTCAPCARPRASS